MECAAPPWEWEWDDERESVSSVEEEEEVSPAASESDDRASAAAPAPAPIGVVIADAFSGSHPVHSFTASCPAARAGLFANHVTLCFVFFGSGFWCGGRRGKRDEEKIRKKLIGWLSLAEEEAIEKN